MKINWNYYSRWTHHNVLVGFNDHSIKAMFDKELSFDGLFPTPDECKMILTTCPHRDEAVIPEYVEVDCWLESNGTVRVPERFLVTYDDISKTYRIEAPNSTIIYQNINGEIKASSDYTHILQNKQRIPYSDCRILK